MTNIKKTRGKLRPMASQGKQSLAAKRLLLLIQQLLAEGGGTRGTKANIARALQLDPAVVSDFLTRKRRNVKGEIIDRLIRHFRSDDGRILHQDFFYKELTTEPRYRDYLRTPGRVSSPPPPHDDEPDDDYTEDDLIKELQPTERELKGWAKAIKHFRYPSTAPWVKRLYILARRDGKGPETAMDDALDKIGDEIARNELPPSKKR